MVSTFHRGDASRWLARPHRISWRRSRRTRNSTPITAEAVSGPFPSCKNSAFHTVDPASDLGLYFGLASLTSPALFHLSNLPFHFCWDQDLNCNEYFTLLACCSINFLKQVTIPLLPLPYSSDLNFLLIGFKCIKLQNPDLVHSPVSYCLLNKSSYYNDST